MGILSKLFSREPAETEARSASPDVVNDRLSRMTKAVKESQEDHRGKVKDLFKNAPVIKKAPEQHLYKGDIVGKDRIVSAVLNPDGSYKLTMKLKHGKPHQALEDTYEGTVDKAKIKKWATLLKQIENEQADAFIASFGGKTEWGDTDPNVEMTGVMNTLEQKLKKA